MVSDESHSGTPFLRSLIELSIELEELGIVYAGGSISY
jgi:hypothetical protein